MRNVSENLSVLYSDIARVAESCGRDPRSVRLIAVSKTVSPELIAHAVAAGQFRFGENRVQEAAEKIPRVSSTGKILEWHLVGHLQSNKARKAASLFDWVHSVDSLKVLEKLNAGAAEADRRLSVLIQIDLAGEKTKSGLGERDLEPLLCHVADCPHLAVRGLMVIPPFLDNPEHVRPYFRRLRELRDRIGARDYAGVVMEELSMGMSHDYRVAIAEGATMVRIGTAVFGDRGPTK